MASVAGGRITAGVGANLIGQHAQDRNQDATVYVGNLDVQVYVFLARYCVCLIGNLLSDVGMPSSEFLMLGILLVQLSEELVWELFVQSGPVGERFITSISLERHAFLYCRACVLSYTA